MRRNNSIGFFSFLIVGGFMLWRNRNQVQQFLQSYGINLPLDTDRIRDTLRSGVSKVTGEVEHHRTFSPGSDQKVG